jgi:hypothetical protein
MFSESQKYFARKCRTNSCSTTNVIDDTDVLYRTSTTIVFPTNLHVINIFRGAVDKLLYI